MEATDNAAVVAVLSLLKVNFKETMQNFAHWRQLNMRKKIKNKQLKLLLIWIHSVDLMTLGPTLRPFKVLNR